MTTRAPAAVANSTVLSELLLSTTMTRLTSGCDKKSFTDGPMLCSSLKAVRATVTAFGLGLDASTLRTWTRFDGNRSTKSTTMSSNPKDEGKPLHHRTSATIVWVSLVKKKG